MSSIKYVGYYDPTGERYNVYAASDKMDYLMTMFTKRNKQLELLSFSYSVRKKLKRENVKIDNNIIIKYPFSFYSKFKIIRLLNRLIILFQNAFELIFNTKKEDTVIVYHSIFYMNTIKYIHKLKKFNLIIEVEEIYADVDDNKRLRKKEFNYFKSADGFIFPTKKMNNLINEEKKPYAICEGVYLFKETKNKIISNNKINCVYAGNFNPIKGGVYFALDVAEKLSSSYKMNILGSGTKEEIDYINNRIEKINSKNGCYVEYHGILRNEDLDNFLSNCDIGLSTQNPNNLFNDTSFPSKILVYLKAGLRVVSSNVEVVRNSNIKDIITICDDDSIENFVEKLKSIDLTESIDFKYEMNQLSNNLETQLDEMGVI